MRKKPVKRNLPNELFSSNPNRKVGRELSKVEQAFGANLRNNEPREARERASNSSKGKRYLPLRNSFSTDCHHLQLCVKHNAVL